jgi:hypothetical protein
MEEIKQETTDPKHCQITYSGHLWYDGVIFKQQGVFDREGRRPLRVFLEGFTKKDV